MLEVKDPPASAGDLRNAGSIPGSEKYLGEGNVNPLQYSCMENPMDRGTWWVTVRRVTIESDTIERLTLFTMKEIIIYLTSGYLRSVQVRNSSS